MWCIQKIDLEYRERMYDILDLYQEPYNPKKPVIGIDEKPKQLIGDKRPPIPMTPRKPEKYDYEYIRNGKANIFVAVEPKAGKRTIQVTDRRTKQDFAQFLKNIAFEKYPDADKIRIVIDNLNTHFKSSFYETFDKEEADRILSKFEFHYTPKHASWLNVAEIEINVMDIECTEKRIKDKETLTREVMIWTEKRNHDEKKINWEFTKEDAYRKLSTHYDV